MTEDSSSAQSLTDEDLKAVEAVKGRLKFFFSDANVRQDFFIRRHLMNDKSKLPRQVTIESLLRFNTIKQHTTKAEVVAKAAKELSDVLTVNEEGTAIGRVVPFTQEMMDGHIAKSLHLKNIPLKKKEGGDEDSMEYAVSVDEIRGLFEKYGEVAMVKLKWSANPEKNPEGDDDGRKKKKKYPTGCALVEFSAEADLEKAAEATLTTKDGEAKEPEDKIVLGDEKAEVQVMLLSEIKQQSDSPSKKRKGDDEADDDVEVKRFAVDWQPGCVIKIAGVPADCDREALLETIAASMGISVEEVKDKKIYVDYSRGSKDGAIRFPEHGEHIAAMCTKLAEGTLQIKDSKVESARILEGDEEKKYWDEFIAFKNRQIQQRADEKRGRKKHRSK